jgi:dimethylargininase
MTSPSPWSRLKKPLSDVALVAGEVPRTAHRIASAGYEVRTIAADELAKAEGGLTCCSVVYPCRTS